MTKKLTLKQFTQELECDEPNYNALKKYGDKLLPDLGKLLKNKDPMLAAKATSLAAMINSLESRKLVKKACSHKDVMVRCAAAHGAMSMASKDSEPILLGLLSDRSPDVKVRALASARNKSTVSIKDKVAVMAKNTKAPYLKKCARDALKAML